MYKFSWIAAFVSTLLLCLAIDSEKLPIWLLSFGLLLGLIAAWKTAIRNRSFGILGFSDLLLKEPRAAKLDKIELFLISLGVSIVAGAMLSMLYKMM